MAYDPSKPAFWTEDNVEKDGVRCSVRVGVQDGDVIGVTVMAAPEHAIKDLSALPIDKVIRAAVKMAKEDAR